MSKIKVLGFMTIHYAGDYLKESLLSVLDHVDKMVIAYSKQPSQGHGTDLACPDSEEYIYQTCKEVLGDKLIWDRADRYGAENEHRNVKYIYSNGFDLVLTVDSDEVYKSDELEASFDYAFWGVDKFYGIDGYLNFWRSFNHVCLDGFRPIRLENLHRRNDTQNLNLKQTIYHFSTCQPEAIMRYKYRVFGHASEVKKNWLDDIFYKWTSDNDISDLHCVSYNLWNAVPFDKNTLPDSLKIHKNFNKDLI
jgi:hypothetical protein